MRRGFALLSTMLVLLWISGIAVPHLPGSTATSRSAPTVLASDITGLLPEGGTCLNCHSCRYYAPGDTVGVDGHYTNASGVTSGTGFGGTNHGDCYGRGWDTMCGSAAHPTINCGKPQAALPPSRAERLEELALAVSNGSFTAYAQMLREFPDLVTIDNDSGVVLFAGCREGVYSGILPIPTHAS